MENAELHGNMCNECSLKINHKSLKFSNHEFVKNANLVHNNKYDYSLVSYEGSSKNVIIICPTHGKFKQRASNHLRGFGCKLCSYKKYKEMYSSTVEEFTKKSNLIHGNKYDYSKTIYRNREEKVTIICPTHGEFNQTAGGHLNGKGCPKCIHRISSPEIEFLDYLNVKTEDRQHRISPYFVDGIYGNVVYEFLGDYYHGNPEVFSGSAYNKVCNTTFEVLYNKTMLKFKELKSRGYTVKYIWENDWNKFKRGIETTPKINEFVKF